MPEPASVAEALQRANDYYITTSTFQSNGWARGVYQPATCAPSTSCTSIAIGSSRWIGEIIFIGKRLSWAG